MRGLTVIDEPRHTESVQFLVKELYAELSGQKRHVLDDC